MTTTNPPTNPALPTAAVLDSIADGVFTVDLNWQITSFNRAAEQIIGISREDAIGKPCCEVFRADICEGACSLKQTMETGQPIVNKAIYVITAEGTRTPISISTALLRDAAGTVVGGAETFRDLSLVEELRKELAKAYTFADIISKNHKMQELLGILPQVALSTSTVLVTGESGTGKELIAKAIHSLSERREGPFVAVNCGALPDALLESELFGHVAGAFTDAKRDRDGRFTQADGGTIFLDEIGDISSAFQIRLLRVLQEREFEPVGASRTRKVDVRVVCATHQDLGRLVTEGTFRRDLYYRVNVVPIPLPPLRERLDDIPLLVDHFVAHFNRLQGKNIAGISTDVMAALVTHDWPGNVRELENVLEHAFILCPGGMIDLPHLPHAFQQEISRPVATGKTLAEIERRAIYDALERNGGKKLAAARELGVNKTTLWRKLKKAGLPDAD
ncbi:MAG: sigma 54-interacting transcriptional regulator [Lentisphaerae bacterium]|jgi:PAS domain S-box-containing protein|nr:sigma 54-interacting transcriptional regulator [Lentisphaerota bacterium]MBT4823536.1 sigma 54-interacting transcriptional regulator [Lentisphaerota bacterium]MBT5612710.1 sigma 54-interacting transcriptional regulator [Lentisphaerota bacterium]MBT7060329.1 sigma 54-interacting transcriptional regulator [Lentisphaerota bacterium]MBT7845609.1 sigma 54-interacting transcriptional regulator [Lentisphaerota bacterium]